MLVQDRKFHPSLSRGSATIGLGDAASHASIKESNLALVAATVLRKGGGLSRADVAEEAGLTKATVSRLVKELLKRGVLVEGEVSAGASIGRPGTPLFPASWVGIGLEINTDRIEGAALDLAGNLVDYFQLPGDFSKLSPEESLELLVQQAEDLRTRLEQKPEVRIMGASLAIPGLVDSESGKVVYAPNLGWRDVEAAAALEPVLNEIPLFVDNDANMQARAIASHGWDGDPALPESFLYLTGDRGIGGALVREGRIDLGPGGWAGEIGHVTIEPDGPACHCGSSGCLERYAGQLSILQAAEISAEVGNLEAALKAGDPAALQAVERAGWALGIGLSNAVNLLDIDTVVLGTSLGALLPWLEGSAREQLKVRVLGNRGRNVQIFAAPVQKLAASIGGALHALEGALKKDFTRLNVLD